MEIIVRENKLESGFSMDGIKALLDSIMQHGAETTIAAFVEERDDGWYKVVMEVDDATAESLLQEGRTPAEAFGQHVQDIMARLGGDRSLGALSQKYESDGDPGAFGTDRAGGPSYGAYQFASHEGSVANFLRFLKTTEPDFAAKLDAAGGDAAARAGNQAFKDAWKAIATNHRDRFLDLQHGFVKASYYDPFVDRVKDQIDLDVNSRSDAVKNAAWSTAVQHGPANNVFKNALSGAAIPDGHAGDKKVIEAVYDERAKVGTYFPRVPELHDSLKNRFASEKADALAMLA